MNASTTRANYICLCFFLFHIVYSSSCRGVHQPWSVVIESIEVVNIIEVLFTLDIIISYEDIIPRV